MVAAARLVASSLLAVSLAAGAARGDVFVLRGGDRITGKPVLEGKRTFKVQTPYGVLTIPRATVDRILRPDGTEVLVNPETAEAVASREAAARRRARLILIVTGNSFWQAWDPKTSPAPDPTLRLEVSLDEEVMATYSDARTDPDIPGALVNTFSFGAEDVAVAAEEHILVLPPEPRPGRIALKMDVPPASFPRRLRLAYQASEGPPEDRVWRDLVTGAIEVELKDEAPTFVRVDQDRGRMEFGGFPRRRMKYVETFKLDLRPEPADAGAPPEREPPSAEEPPLTP
jgi:hypothetical protein